MHLKKVFVVALVAAVAISGTAMAQVSGIRVESNPDAFDGHVVNDIIIDFAGQYTGSQMIVNLTSGGIYQDPNDLANTPPNEAFFAVFPNLQWDTFVANGGPTAAGNLGNFGLGGGAVNLGGEASATFGADGINQGWNPAGGVTIVDQTNFLAARVTLTNDANGDIIYSGFAGGQDPTQAQRLAVPIVNGVIGGGGVVIPEPSTFVLLGLCLVGAVVVRRRKG